MTVDDLADYLVDLMMGRKPSPLSFMQQASIPRLLLGGSPRELLRTLLQTWIAKDPKARAMIQSWIGPHVH